MIRCKFEVVSVTHRMDDVYDVEMRAVTSGSEENDEFWKYTPSGHLKFQTINGIVADHLIPGKEYYLNIVPSEENKEG